MTDGWFRHPQSLVESDHIGPGTRVWAFAHILPNAQIGADCNICDHVFIENDVRVGDRVTIKCGVQLWDGVILEDDVFVGPNASFTNDNFPRSRQYLAEPMRTIVKSGASIGANATILPGITIGQRAMVGAGAVVIHNVPPNAIVVGNPAYICGYADSETVAASTSVAGEAITAGGWKPRVKGVSASPLPIITDLRGSLVVAEIAKGLPFQPKRFFTIFDVPTREVRGEHAHRTLHQFLVCLKGECAVLADDGHCREEIHLNTPAIGVHIPPMVWAVQYKFSQDAVLLVLASDIYNPQDYIRDYDEYRRLITDTEKQTP
jgi:acetyltransferase-like isoleucine patch superfamily enzyme/dTDP-4-dehydrorhamnose 3,5-epimerase-like enzyme